MSGPKRNWPKWVGGEWGSDHHKPYPESEDMYRGRESEIVWQEEEVPDTIVYEYPETSTIIDKGRGRR